MDITNLELKNIRKLKDKKYRKELGLFLVEGAKACEELVNSNYQIKYTLSCDEKYKHYPNFVLIDYDVLKSIATTDSPQNVICVSVQPNMQQISSEGNSLVLDELQDPGNLGTLIRSALAFNFKNIYLINSVDPFSEKVIRSTMGAIFKVNICKLTREEFILNKDKICDFLIGTDLSSIKLEKKELKDRRVAVVIGNEGNGVSKDMLAVCDKVVTLPMTKEVESLNASVAGSILMYEVFKK